MGQPNYATRRNAMVGPTNPATPSPITNQNTSPRRQPGTGPISSIISPPGFDSNRGDPNVRKSAKLVVNAPVAPITPTVQPAAQQQQAAIAAQQAAFWANHEAAQRMREEARLAAEEAAQTGGD